ncbi:mucoidy inhibitor MuiA family protein [Verrucomicrobiota bacterium]
MKRFILTTLSFFCVWSILQAAEQDKVMSVSSAITEVTVYSDRARITRSAALKLKKGSVTYAFQKLPGWVDEESVRVALSSADSARIADVRVKRKYLAQANDEDVRKAESAVREISDQIGALDDELKVLGAQTKQIESIRVFSLEKLPKDAAVRKIDVKSYGEVVDFVADSMRDVARKRREVSVKRRELHPELSARQRKLNELRKLTQLEESTILVTVEAESSQQKTLYLTYMLPGATWEPAHELRAKGKEPGNVKLSSYAVVTQTSGEDWNGVAIFFSTQSSTETIRIPELDSLLIGNSSSMVQVMGGQNQSFRKAQQTYEGQNRLWINTRNPGWDEQLLIPNMKRQQIVQGRISRIFKTLQKRGTSAHFAGQVKPTVRTDGSSIRIPIGEIILDAKTRIVAAPQASLNAARTVEMVNAGKQPLLPGKVSLYHDGAFLGMTDVEFIAEGEPFSIFLGVADHIKLSRTLDRKHSSIVRGRRTRMQIAFEISVENLSEDKVSLSLTDRVPVSQNKEIEVDKIKISPDGEPDSKGLLMWNITLKPGEKRVYRIEYRIEYPPAIVERIKRSKSSPISPADRSLSIQIQDLEARF